MIYTAPEVNPKSSPLRAKLRALYVETGDQAALRELDQVERREAMRAGSVVRLVAHAAPYAMTAIVFAVSVYLAPETLANVEHSARVLGVAAVPLLTKLATLRFLT